MPAPVPDHELQGDYRFTGAVETTSAFYLPGGVLIKVGTGTPEAAVVAPIGSLFLNLSGGVSTTLYVKTSGTGNTGWTAK